MGFLKNILDASSFLSAPAEQKRITFYSEGKVYWVHLEGLVRELLFTHNVDVSYISSGKDDPGLKLEHPQYHTYQTDESWVRNWLFESLNCQLLIMTMPDLGQYQIKRSKHNVNYVYVQHSLVSMHMVYRPGAFDYFDTIFCAGPHHIEEIRAQEDFHHLPSKKLVNHGYARLDSIIGNVEKNKPAPQTARPLHVLLAPSWGANSITDLVLEPVLEILLAAEFKVTFRPHPQSLKFSKAIINKTLKRFSDNPLFDFESNVASEKSLHESDVMICDWSGAALDYAFGLQKPVISIDVPRKVNNPDYVDLKIEPFEASIRHKIGAVVSVDDLNELPNAIDIWHKKNLAGQCEFQGHGAVYNIGQSATYGATELLALCS